MNTDEFIEFAQKLSTNIITEVSQDDVLLLKDTMEEHPAWITLAMQVVCSHKASDLCVALFMKVVPKDITSDNITLNAFIYLLFITKSKRFKREMLTYLRSLENSDVNNVLDIYFPSP
jgi:hypothetical protein